MFIDDRGEVIGSIFKDFLKYGGKWEPEIHSIYGTVCITNKYNTSQTCMFCNNKLLDPKAVITKRYGSDFAKRVNKYFYCANHLCPLIVYIQDMYRHVIE